MPLAEGQGLGTAVLGTWRIDRSWTGSIAILDENGHLVASVIIPNPQSEQEQEVRAMAIACTPILLDIVQMLSMQRCTCTAEVRMAAHTCLPCRARAMFAETADDVPTQ